LCIACKIKQWAASKGVWDLIFEPMQNPNGLETFVILFGSPEDISY
jgi:hypothetical protein